jgi:hypothetical protein
MHNFNLFGHLFDVFLVIVGSLRVTWGSSEGNQRSFLIGFQKIPEHFVDICLVDPGSIQDSPGIIFKHF